MHAPGTLIEGKYEILGKIREGGMGAIYRVRHRLLDQVRVIKVLKPSVLANAELKQRFVAEAKTATRLKHPNICTIHDFALDDDGTAYLVMEYIDGVTLAELGRTPTPVPITLEITHQALQALGYLHRRNVVHRDIAPDNLMLTTDEEGHPLVKLIDLGIAKALDRPGEMTSTGVFLGKLRYASPEQYGALTPGEKIDGRSDIYCLGIVIYELLTGARPFSGDTPAEMLRAHLFAPPLPFEQSDPNGRVPAELRGVLFKALEKKREDRYLSAEDFDRDIERVRTRYSDDPDDTIAFVSNARATRDVGGVGITPSAQDRLDRHFGAGKTPPPAPSTASAHRVSRDVTEAIPAKTTTLGPKEAQVNSGDLTPPAFPAYQALPPARLGLILGIGVAVLAAAVVAYWLLHDKSADPGGSTASVIPVRPTAAAATTESTPRLPETPAPLEAPVVLPPPAAAPTEAPTRPARAAAAPTARPSAPTPRPRPTPEARRPAEIVARSEPTALPAAPPTSPPLPASTPVPAVVVLPTAAPRPTAAEPHPTAVNEAERVRETIRRWERAQNTLDADAYSRVYPRVDRARIQAAFDGFRSQTVTFDQVRVEVAPGSNKATVHLFERRVAVPRVGAEQQAEGNRTISLRKDGENWVITEVQ